MECEAMHIILSEHTFPLTPQNTQNNVASDFGIPISIFKNGLTPIILINKFYL